MVTTRGHMEEKKQEMPDVHQPDLSVAGEQGENLGYLHHQRHPSANRVQTQILE